MKNWTTKSAKNSVNSNDLLAEKLQSKGIDVHCNDDSDFSLSIDGVCFTISAIEDWGYCYLDYGHCPNES